MFIIIPTIAHVSSIEIHIEIAATCFGVFTPSSGSLQVVLAKVMNYLNYKVQYSSMSL
jgi:hypothetical protein